MLHNNDTTDVFIRLLQVQELPQRHHEAKQAEQPLVHQGQPGLHRTVQVRF